MPETAKTGTSGSKPTPSGPPEVGFRSPRKRRENYEEKAKRYLAEGRLSIVTVNRVTEQYEALVRGSNRIYNVGWDPVAVRMECDCPARSVCCHIRAFELVVIPT